MPIADRAPTATVFAPSPLLTITLDTAPNGDSELHVHAGGQGHWIARMATNLGLEVTLTGAFGGESGAVLRDLIHREGITVRSVDVGQESGSYIHDRRNGDRTELATIDPPHLVRHALDDLYGITLESGASSDIVLLGGPHTESVVPADFYRRLASDLASLHKPVVADLSGPTATAALQGGLTVLKMSHEDLVEDGRATSDDPDVLIEAMRALHDEGAHIVVLSRAAEPALALVDGAVLEVITPGLEQTDHHGAGDSMSAGIATGLARGMPIEKALALGGAAGTANVTRRGLGTGQLGLVETIMSSVEVRPYSP